MIKYDLNYNPILEYWNKIKSGEEVVSEKIKKTYKKIVLDLNTKTSEWYYEPKRGNHIIEFIENFCRHSKGKMGGKPVILELWEKAMLATIFGFIDINGNRKYREAILIIGKKNGKSLLASCVGLYLQVADNEPGAEIYATATKKDQAKIIWQEAKRMVKKSPVLGKRIKTLVNELVSDFNDGVFKPLSSDSNTLDGLNIHGGLMDEIHQWKNGKALYDIIADGVTAREQPLIFITSTAGTIREDLYDQKYDEAKDIINGYDDKNGIKDERFIAFIYEIDKRCEWTDEKAWKKANPGLGTIKNLEILKHKVEKAKNNPLLVKNLVCKEFNIAETTSQTWLTFEQLNNTATFDIKKLKPKYCFVGIDLSATVDLTSACILFRIKESDIIYANHMYWIPNDLLEKRKNEDKIPYDIWYDQGFLRVSAGNKVNYKDVTNWLLEVQNELDIYIYKIGYDSWSSTYLIDELKQNFGTNCTEPVIQGKKTCSAPLKRIASDLGANKINYNNNPITKWCLSNTAIDIDKNDNISIVKTSNQKRRIDGTAALMDAFVVYEKNLEDYLNLI
jgi:phage terminase large subunit-like protein